MQIYLEFFFVDDMLLVGLYLTGISQSIMRLDMVFLTEKITKRKRQG